MIFASFRNFLFYFLNRFLFNRGASHVALSYGRIPARTDRCFYPLDLSGIGWP
jgi:hypothetical protein